jgi:hypothetical protein
MVSIATVAPTAIHRLTDFLIAILRREECSTA